MFLFRCFSCRERETSYADLKLLKPITKKLKIKATLHIIEGADHSFHLLKSSVRNDEEVLKEIAKEIGEWGTKV